MVLNSTQSASVRYAHRRFDGLQVVIARLHRSAVIVARSSRVRFLGRSITWHFSAAPHVVLKRWSLRRSVRAVPTRSTCRTLAVIG